jgi:hypothetical protein
VAGAFLSRGVNLFSSTAGGTGFSAADLVVADPLLSPLASNGGLTQTHALLSNSPAIDAGTNAGTPTRDQRGFLRSGATDLGAYEYEGIGLTLIDVTRPANNFTVYFQGVPGLTYRLERKATVFENSWQNIPGVADVTVTSEDVSSVIDPSTLNLSQAVYRVRLLP